MRGRWPAACGPLEARACACSPLCAQARAWRAQLLQACSRRHARVAKMHWAMTSCGQKRGCTGQHHPPRARLQAHMGADPHIAAARAWSYPRTLPMRPPPRRFTWELIRAHRGRACVVLTTHSMEEADVLGDDVVIVVRVRWCIDRCAG